MSDFIEIGKTGELENGTMKEVDVQGNKVLLAKVGDRYYAADGHCPHLGGKLASGKLDGTVITCPRHGSQFDLVDGRVVRWLKGSGLVSQLGKALKAPMPLRTYEVKSEGDRILINYTRLSGA